MRIIITLFLTTFALAQSRPAGEESYSARTARVSAEFAKAYPASRFSALSANYFSHFGRDPEAEIAAGEIEIGDDWRIAISAEAGPIAQQMAGDLAVFLKTCMALDLPVAKLPAEQLAKNTPQTIRLLESGGGAPDSTDSFSIDVGRDSILVSGQNGDGLRDGVVKLVDVIGLRQAPFLRTDFQVYRPRLPIRLGAAPRLGSCREVAFLGYNAVNLSGFSVYTISTSDAIAELIPLRYPNVLAAKKNYLEEAQRYGLKVYASLSMPKFAKDHPVFVKNPELRGALTWKADGDYVLCTEHPLVRRYLTETIEGFFRAVPQLQGVILIIGGESFYHCFMRPHGVEKGHTNCPRCESLGPDVVVSNLCNTLAEGARRVNPKAEIIAWPYSAEWVWSSDRAQSGFIRLLKPGTAIFTEIEKDEVLEKRNGIKRHLGDYSIDLIGPGERAKQQIELCKAANIPIYMKSEPECTLDAPRLPHIPCMDRWADRAEALAGCGASGAFVYSGFRQFYGTSAAEINKHFWWHPAISKEEFLQLFARRMAGRLGGAYLRASWHWVSDAIPLMPEWHPYYTGPYYLGPAHPMCADPQAPLPKIFDGYFLFLSEITDAEGSQLRPTYMRSPAGNIEVCLPLYRLMQDQLLNAADDVNEADKLVPPQSRLMFDAEASSIRYFYHTVCSQANFYESCQLRDALLALAATKDKTPEQVEQAKMKYARWKKVLEDEKANALAALPVAEADIRLDSFFGGDHSFSHTADMIRAKLELLEKELTEFLPSVARRCEITP